METKITMAFTMDSGAGVRKHGLIPWDTSEPSKIRLAETEGKVCISSLETFVIMTNALGSAVMEEVLKKRIAFVVSDEVLNIPNVNTVNSFEDGVEKGKVFGKEVMILGSTDMYWEVNHLLDEVKFVMMPDVYDCDTTIEQQIDHIEKHFKVYDMQFTPSGIKHITYRRA